MPLVEVNMWEPVAPERAKKVIEGITKAFVDLGTPAEAVQIIVREVPKTHWASGGVCHSERPPRS